MKHKNYDYQSIEPFEKIHQRKGWAGCCSKKCFEYYKTNTDKNINESVKLTFKYIKSYYTTKRFNKSMSSRDIKNNANVLLERYKKLDSSFKYSISIITSSVISFIGSLFFTLFTFSNNGENNYLVNLLNMLNEVKSGIADCDPTILMAFFPILLPVFLLCLFACFLPFICACIYPIIVSKVICSINSTYKQIIVPFEINEIIDTLKTYDQGYSKLK